jgi:hypothetical protein
MPEKRYNAEEILHSRPAYSGDLPLSPSQLEKNIVSV